MIFPALQKTEILPENPVSETRNHRLGYNNCCQVKFWVIKPFSTRKKIKFI